MKLRWEVVHADDPLLARIQASTLHKLPCGCEVHYTAVPVDMVNIGWPESFHDVVHEFEYLHKNMGCPR